MNRLKASAISLFAFSMLSACGDGSQQQPSAAERVKLGGPQPAAAAVPAAPPTQRVALAGLNIEVAAHAGWLQLHVAEAASVRKVTALVGSSYEQATPLAITQQEPGIWRMDWPSPSSGTLLLRFELSNGDVLESAPGDFPF